MTTQQLCFEISQIISSYADNKFGTYDTNHVKRWIDQFDQDEQELVLEETLHILKTQYMTKDTFIAFVSDVLSFEGICGDNPKEFWSNASLLQIQLNGNSQSQLNDIFCSVLQEKYQVNNIVNANSSDYFYVDDFVFSGNRLFTDIKNWLEIHDPRNCKLNVVVIGYYTYGEYNTKRKLEELFKGRGISLCFYRYGENILENRLRYKNTSERFWPAESVLSEPSIQAYVTEKGLSDFPYRNVVPHTNKVFSANRREQYERIMLKYGIKIVGFPRNNNAVVKPLGYDTFNSFGFGSTVFTFRNCPNNNPLPFWWGDPEAPEEHPFSKWYPLLQRSAYRD
ncbi:phosphoribosyltransferase-like protein [Vibrio harveyi]|uniref:phosphoribosyltransferase-like protein n=1 Tax=Vibrio harveyi TaxID=669 RepID=UPI002119DEC8|nr:hypothetical protein [Vibrio harveyi]MCQ9082172.1 hypothetical protein [Vibrio harveyi]